MTAVQIPVTPNAYCYDNVGKRQVELAVKRFYRAAARMLPEFTVKVHFNPGGIAVWGECYARFYRGVEPVVEAWNVTDWNGSARILVRQWNGNNSGANTYVATLEDFVSRVRTLAGQSFRRF